MAKLKLYLYFASRADWVGNILTSSPSFRARIPTSLKPANAHLHAHRTYSFSMG